MCFERKPLDLDNLEKDFFKKHASIEASAGTGKTYTIQQLVKRLIESDGSDLVGGKPVKLSEILLVTFTEKATGELRDRIRAIFEESAETSCGDKKIRLEEALRTIDQAPIYTFHSFCDRVLRQYGFEAGFNDASALIDKKQIKYVINRRCRDDWANNNETFKEILEHNFATAEEIIDKLTQLANCYEPETMQFIDKCDIKAAKELYNKEIAFDWNTAFDDAVKFMDENHKNWKLKNAKIDKENRTISGYGKASLATDLGKFQGAEQALQTFAKCNKKTPQEIKNEATKTYKKKLLNYFCQTEMEAIFKEWQKYKKTNFTHTFNDLIETVYKSCTAKPESTLLKELRRKYRYGIIDEFQDTNVFQWGIFKSIFLDCPSNRIYVVGDPKQSIYKFQGADIAVYNKATQKHILSQENIDKGISEGYRLESNYRSSAAIIGACNALCSFAGKTLFDDPIVPFTPSKYGNQDPNFISTLNGKEVPAIWVSQNEISKNSYAKFAVEQIENIVGRIKIPQKNGENRFIKYSDIAILIRSKNDTPPFEAELQKKLIPFILYKDQNLFKDAECKHWSILLRTIATVDNSDYSKQIKRTALITPFIGKTLDEAHNFDFENRKDSFALKLSEWQKLAQSRKWVALVQEIFKQTSIEETLMQHGKYQEIAKYHQIGEYIQECLCKNCWSITKMADHLDRLSNGTENPIAENADYVSNETDKDVVRVMTIHQSKGLEFPVVIVAGSANGSPSSSPYIFAHNEDESNPESMPTRDISLENSGTTCNEEQDETRRIYYVAITRSKFIMILPRYIANGTTKGAAKLFIRPAIKKLFEQKNGEESYEENNAFVAYTSHDIGKEKIPVTQINSFLKELKKINVQANTTQNTDFDILEKDLGNKLHSIKNSGNKDKSGLYCKATSYSDLTRGEHEAKPANSRGDEFDSDQTGVQDASKRIGASFDDSDYPRGNVFGTAIHSVLEELDFEEARTLIDSDASTEPGVRDEIATNIKQIFNNNGVTCNKKVIENTLHIIAETMNAKIPKVWDKDGNVAANPTETFKLGDLPRKNYKAEMEFNMGAMRKKIEQETQISICAKDTPTWFFNGFIDLLFRIDGRYCILDWKGNYIEDYSSDGIYNDMINNSYTVQRALYSIILIEWLANINNVEDDEGKEKIYRDMFGGVYYCYLRGTRRNTDIGFNGHRYRNYAELKEDFKKNVEFRLLKI